jgi:polyisoprenoid-binding protein YceI
MKNLLAALALSALPFAAFGESYVIDQAHTFPSFEVSHFGFSTFRGRFDKTSGVIALDLKRKSGAAEIVIDAGSVSTGVAKLDEHLRSADFLDVAKYPTMNFKGTKFSFDGDKLTSVDGELTIHGTTKPVTLTVKSFKCADHPMKKVPVCGADLNTTIKRSEFGVSTGSPNIGEDVTLQIQVEAVAGKAAKASP